ncbi:unnamed protein product [Prunus armeniaca]|uniref:Uncharacterized protein n=1 Tax=Prunus armeniaca TaxID=36596 RepID=A0A6J5UZ35_PRUAR|nr:hypothetical protein GBA52_017337 [Prunus armeniaca]CAB4280694.1 unnamed protein product [Prunus armeniaca]CAB4311098.1 unnamed protein product [Prunus armeniaca]
MSRNYENPTKSQNGSDYYSHLQRIARSPSVLTEVPHYGQTLFNNQASVREDHGGYQKNERKPEVKSVEETIDVQADGFIKGNHKGFELCKWKTYKGR